MAMKTLRDYFKENPHTERDLAVELNVTREYIRMLKMGVKTPGLKLACRIEEITGVSVKVWHGWHDTWEEDKE